MSRTDDRMELAANRLIETLMKTVLGQAAGATRVRLALIHEGCEPGATSATLPRYDVTNSVAARGRAIGLTPRNQPMSDLKAFMPALLANECKMKSLPCNSVPGGAPRYGLAADTPGVASRMTTALACPAAREDGQMAGALFILWDGSVRPPSASSLLKLKSAAQRAATQIVMVWDLCRSG